MPKFYSVRRPSPNKMPEGMYSSEFGLLSCPSYSTDCRHPAPEEDSGLGWDTIEYELGFAKPKLYFGFANLTQLRAWLYRDEWREHLSDYGFVVMVWDLPEVGRVGAPCMKAGNSQAVATRESLCACAPRYLSLLNLESTDADF